MRTTRTNLLNMKIQRVVTFAYIGFLACVSITFAKSYVESGSLDPLFIVYETDPSQLTKSADNFLMQQITDRNLHDDAGAATALVGLGQEWNGWGSKAKHVSSKLAKYTQSVWLPFLTLATCYSILSTKIPSKIL